MHSALCARQFAPTKLLGALPIISSQLNVGLSRRPVLPSIGGRQLLVQSTPPHDVISVNNTLDIAETDQVQLHSTSNPPRLSPITTTMRASSTSTTC